MKTYSSFGVLDIAALHWHIRKKLLPGPHPLPDEPPPRPPRWVLPGADLDFCDLLTFRDLRIFEYKAKNSGKISLATSLLVREATRE